MAAAIRSTRLFHQIAIRLGISLDEPEVRISQAQFVYDLFKSDDRWKPGNGAVIWSDDEKHDIKEIAEPVTAGHLRKLSRDNPDALMVMLQSPSLRSMIVASTDEHTGDLSVESSLAEEALCRHGDEAARLILSSPALREQPAMKPLGWVEGRSTVAKPREGCLAFQALDYTGSLEIVFDYPDLWDMTVDPTDENSETWIGRAERLADMRNDPAAFHIRKARRAEASILPSQSPRTGPKR